jgi:uncharacterized cysteine cluster protein YcgN (CxxCxxCC family)
MSNAAISDEEWESRCKGCGECCFEKIEDDNGTIFYLMSACRYLDLETRQCRIYENRFIINPDCVKLTARLVPTLRWLPRDCGYCAAPQLDVPPMTSRGRSRRKKSR